MPPPDRNAVCTRRPRGSPWLANHWLHVFAAALGLSLAAPTWGAGCGQVELRPLAPLQFGTLGVGPRKRGWIVLEPSGGHVIGGNLSVLGRTPPSPGQLRVSAPAGSTVSLRSIDTRVVKEGTELGQITLGSRGRLLDRSGDLWILHIPENTQTSHLEVEVQIGARLSLRTTDSIRTFSHPIQIECVDVTP